MQNQFALCLKNVSARLSVGEGTLGSDLMVSVNVVWCALWIYPSDCFGLPLVMTVYWCLSLVISSFHLLPPTHHLCL